MARLFPDPREANKEGLVAVGGGLSRETLLEAYRSGIFPWPQEGFPMLWFSPDPRGVLDFQDVHVPRSLARFRKKMEASSTPWTFTINQAFDEVIRGCRDQPRPGQNSTWITRPILAAYQRLFAAGHVMSVECWEGKELIGGVYGVQSGRYFSAESMFHRRSNASKLSLLYLVEELKNRGQTWMDVQMITPVVASLGGKYISREEFLERIAA